MFILEPLLILHCPETAASFNQKAALQFLHFLTCDRLNRFDPSRQAPGTLLRGLDTVQLISRRCCISLLLQQHAIWLVILIFSNLMIITF